LIGQLLGHISGCVLQFELARSSEDSVWPGR